MARTALSVYFMTEEEQREPNHKIASIRASNERKGDGINHTDAEFVVDSRSVLVIPVPLEFSGESGSSLQLSIYATAHVALCGRPFGFRSALILLLSGGIAGSTINTLTVADA